MSLAGTSGFLLSSYVLTAIFRETVPVVVLEEKLWGISGTFFTLHEVKSLIDENNNTTTTI